MVLGERGRDDPTTELARRVRPVPDRDPRARCAWCRRILPERDGPGRPKKFCRAACRQADWVHRQRAAELDLSEHELVVTRDALDRLRDDLYVLACAIEDTERDLAARGDRSQRELRELLDWLLDAARIATAAELAPSQR